MIKLFKYDFRGVGKKLFPIYGLAIAMSILARFIFVNRYFSEDFYTGYEYTPYSWWFEMLSGLTFGMTWMVIAAIFVVTFFVLATQYQKSVFGDEGYLTNTLPIKTEKIIIAKALNFLFWNFVAALISAICVMIMFAFTDIMKEAWTGLLDSIKYAIQYVEIEYWITFGVYILTFMVSSVSGVFLVYFAMAIGSQFRHKVAMGFAAYLAVSTLSSFISQIITTMIWLPDIMVNGDSYGYMPPMFTVSGSIVMLILAIAFCAVYFFGTYYIQKNRLNLE